MRARGLGVRAGALVLAIAALFLALPAEAHPARASAVLLDLRERAIDAELQLPLDQLGLVLGEPLCSSPSSLVAERGPELVTYVKSHLAATTTDQRAFAVELHSMGVAQIDGADHLVVRLSLKPPEGAPANAFTLYDDLILHRVVSHKIFVSVRRDFKNAVFSERPELVGMLRLQRESLRIDRRRGSWWQGFRAVLVLGIRHIAEGTDHLLFLLVLLLPAPLVARDGRWRETRGAAQSAKEVLAIVTAFTLGHSVTLVSAALGLVRVPGRPVEIVIAASILVSAIHALRPVFVKREPLVAAGFGLVHGLAFATVLADLGLKPRALALGVLGFNLGIEVMQVAVVALLMPWLVMLSPTRAYAGIRIAGASLGAIAACGWMGERALGLRNPVAPVVDFVFQRGLHVVAILAIAAGVVSLRRKLAARRHPLAASTPASPSSRSVRASPSMPSPMNHTPAA